MGDVFGDDLTMWNIYVCRRKLRRGKSHIVFWGTSPWCRLKFGKYLALTNMVVWTFNLFFFLVPVFLPRSFKKYYEMEFTGAENRAKDDQDPSKVETSTDF